MSHRVTLVHDDMLGNVQQGAGIAALTTEGFRDTPFLLSMMRHDQDDVICFATQFSHGRKLGSALASIHLHYIPLADPAAPQVVYFDCRYWWATTNVAVPANTSWVASNPTITISPGDVHKLKIASLVDGPIAAPVGEGYSSILFIYLARLGTSPNDTYDTAKTTPPGTAQANFAPVYVDVHYLRDGRGGSLLEYSDV